MGLAICRNALQRVFHRQNPIGSARIDGPMMQCVPKATLRQRLRLFSRFGGGRVRDWTFKRLRVRRTACSAVEG